MLLMRINGQRLHAYLQLGYDMFQKKSDERSLRKRPLPRLQHQLRRSVRGVPVRQSVPEFFLNYWVNGGLQLLIYKY